MTDLCSVNPLQCLNNGQCSTNIPLNTTYCQCDPCHQGAFCEDNVWEQTQFDTDYVRLVIFIIGLCISFLNNGLTLELCIGHEQIRRTNCGIYLLVYSILSFVSNVFSVVDKTVRYYSSQSIKSEKYYDIAHCYIGNVGYNTLVYLCIWFSSFILFEHSLVICFGCKTKGKRWRSVITTSVMLTVAAGSVTPLLLYKCDWNNIPSLKIARGIFVWFYISIGLLIYLLATLFILISITRRIRQYGTENGSFIRTFLKLFYTHLFIFVPPISYTVCYIPFTIVHHQRNHAHAYFQCGISMQEYIIKILLSALQGVPFVITWLLFVYPSKVYMTEYYRETWSGKHVAKILARFR